MSAIEVRVGDIRDRETVLPTGYRFTAEDRERFAAEIPRWLACGVLHEVEDRPVVIEPPRPRSAKAADDADEPGEAPAPAEPVARRRRVASGG